MRHIVITLLLVTLISYVAGAQHLRKANKFFNAAEKSWSRYDREKAYQKMLRSIRKAPALATGYSELGEWYFSQHRFADALYTFQMASEKCPNGHRAFAVPITRSLIACGMADSALWVISRYGTMRDTGVWHTLALQAKFVQQGMQRMQPQWPVSLGPRINTRMPETFPSMTADTGILYFTRRKFNADEDFFVARLDTCDGWLRADNIGAPLNSISNESAQSISADGHYLFFSRSDNRCDNGWAAGGEDLYMAYRIAMDSDWTIPQAFGATINSPAYEGIPTLSPDNRQLYFVSDAPGGYGGTDIWISHFENNLWQPPINAGPNVNTKGNETAPYICLDGKTLLFTSDGHVGFGGTDIYRSEKTSDTSWSKAVNLGYPINTPYDELSEWVVKNGHRMMFASDRQGPAGNFDLYEAELPMNLKPQEVSFAGGYVYDSVSKERLNSAAMYFINATKGDTIYKLMSNRGDASYLVPLAMNTRYALHTARMGYTAVDDTFSFDKPYLYRPFVHNVAMLRTDYLKPIMDSLIAVVHFDINKVELTDTDKAVIVRAIDPFLMDKGVLLTVNGFTDNTGTPMLNEELSTKRANLVAKELAGLGIDELSIVAKGWGEANMIAPNDTEEGQRKNRRVEIVLRR